MNSAKQKQGLVWGGLLILFGIIMLLQLVFDLRGWGWEWALILFLAGFAALGVYLTDRSNVVLLLPVYILWAIAGLIALIEFNLISDAAIPLYVLTAIAIPFLAVFLRDRKQWWALIPAYVLFAVGFMVALLGYGLLSDLLVPAYVMFAIAIPFLAVYAFNSKNWWALIPGGIMAVIGLSFLIAEAAAGLIVPVFLVIAGIWIIVRQFLRKEPAVVEEGTSIESKSE